MELLNVSTSTHELLRILGQFPNKPGFTLPASPDGIRIQLLTLGAAGTTMGSHAIWLWITRLGSVPSGRPGAGNMVVEVILSISASEDRPVLPEDRWNDGGG